MRIGYKCIHDLLKHEIVPSSNLIKCDTIDTSQFILLKGLHFVKEVIRLFHFLFKNENWHHHVLNVMFAVVRR